MKDGRLNCLLEVCCRSAEAEQALADQIAEDLACDPAEAKKHAAWIREHFDLAPKGTLTAFKNAIAKLARENTD